MRKRFLLYGLLAAVFLAFGVALLGTANPPTVSTSISLYDPGIINQTVAQPLEAGTLEFFAADNTTQVESTESMPIFKTGIDDSRMANPASIYAILASIVLAITVYIVRKKYERPYARDQTVRFLRF